MLSSQVLLKTIHDMSGITGADISAWSLEGECICATGGTEAGQSEIIEQFLFVELEEYGNSKTEEQYHIQVVYAEDDPEYILLFEGILENPEVIGSLCVNQLENLLVAYKAPLNKQAFLQNLMKGNIAEEEVGQKAERVRINRKAKRVTYVIEPKKEDEEIVAQTLKSLYVTGITDFVVEMDAMHIAFIKELSTTDTEQDIHHVAETIADTLSAETMIYVRVAYGTVVETLDEVERSYREACIALEVGRSFNASKSVLAYKELGIGRLIHQLPVPLCEEFLQEVLNGNGLAQFDEETMIAAYHFFDNNLNISETARQLYVHRNTLMYRLEKIQKKTGLDVRVFDDAMTFKLAIMVSNHINFLQAK